MHASCATVAAPLILKPVARCGKLRVITGAHQKCGAEHRPADDRLHDRSLRVRPGLVDAPWAALL
jgi:hypothetical protein